MKATLVTIPVIVNVCIYTYSSCGGCCVCVSDILQPKQPSAGTNMLSQSACSNSVQYSYVPELLYGSAATDGLNQSAHSNRVPYSYAPELFNGSAETIGPNQLACSNSVLYSYAPELLYKSASEIPHHSMSSLVDSGCFRSPTNDFPSLSITDDFDSLIRQLKCYGNMDLAISRSPYLQAHHHTVPYFPPVTSALRREHGMFSYPRSSCVEYDDDEALPSPQFLPESLLGRDQSISLADMNSTSVTDLQAFQPLSESIVMQSWSQSCPDVNSPSAANIQQQTAADDLRFNGLNFCYIILMTCHSSALKVGKIVVFDIASKSISVCITLHYIIICSQYLHAVEPDYTLCQLKL